LIIKNPSQKSSKTLQAVGLLLLSTACFDMMSVFIRILLTDFSAQELSAYRNVIGAIPSLLLLLYTRELRFNGPSLVIKQWRLALLRGLSIALAQLCFYSAIGHMELATVSTLGQTNAFFVVILSVIIMGEKVGIWRWTALFLGFLGALLILNPGDDAFSIYALLPIGAAFFYSFTIATLPKFDKSISNGLLYLYSSVAAGIAAVILAFYMTDFSPINSFREFFLIFTMSIFGGIGVLFLMLAYRMISPSALAPFVYFGILTAFLFGWIFFGEFPIETLFPGAFLIVGAGVLVIWRENKARL
jgi:drug/metabolite transporter (DMT)-like permease